MIFDTIHVATITAKGHGASVAAPTQRGQELPWQRQRLKGPTLTHPKTVARGQGAVRPICWFAVGESGVFYPPASSGHCGASSHPRVLHCKFTVEVFFSSEQKTWQELGTAA